MSETRPVHVARRAHGYSYAIRNVVKEAHEVEQSGRRVTYLNIGDPVAFGFATPAHLVEVVARAMRDGHNVYGPSAGLPAAREAIAADCARRGMPLDPERVLVTAGASEAIELSLSALADAGDEVLVPLPTYPLYTAVLTKLGAKACYYRCDPLAGWAPDLRDVERLMSERTRAMVVIHPNNPSGAVYSTELLLKLIELAESRGVVLLADEVYVDLSYSGSVPLLGSLAPDAAVLSFGSLSKAFFAPGWRAGWTAVGKSRRLDPVLEAMLKFADGRLCSPLPPQYAIPAALEGPRAHQEAARSAFAARAQLVMSKLNGPLLRTPAPRAAFYALPQVKLPPGKTDEDFVRGLLHSKGILCVHGSGFGLPAEEGFFRVVFLPELPQLSTALDQIVDFAQAFQGHA